MMDAMYTSYKIKGSPDALMYNLFKNPERFYHFIFFK
jgi:hypothetical protein